MVWIIGMSLPLYLLFPFFDYLPTPRYQRTDFESSKVILAANSGAICDLLKKECDVGGLELCTSLSMPLSSDLDSALITESFSATPTSPQIFHPTYAMDTI